MKSRIDNIKSRISHAAVAAGRDPSDVRLVAVSKTVAPAGVLAAIDAGLFTFGENYIQEAADKIETIADPRLSWHFIGHLQSNKAKFAVQYFHLIHSVDSVKLAAEISKQAKKRNKMQDILIQINISEESTKSGVSADAAFSMVKEISTLENVSVQGLMTMPPFFDQPEKARPYFRELCSIRDQIARAALPGVDMRELSMGMTGDFEVAVEEGATLVRIGTAIFGDRP
jgi:pyridoxal phosphate enzyme (YggS family)